MKRDQAWGLGWGRWQTLILTLALGCWAPGCSDDDEPAKGDTSVADAGGQDLSAEDAPADNGQTPEDQGQDALDQGQEPDKPQTGLLTNAPNAHGSVLLKPEAGEEGHLCAARLTPDAYPFAVWDVRYSLGHGATDDEEVTCNAGLAHTVEIYVASDVAPPANPTPVATLDIAAMNPDNISPDDGRTVMESLDPEIVLNEGEHLFVAIKFAGTATEPTCVLVDPSIAGQSDRNYWSNAAEPPYSWTPLSSFGLNGALLVEAGGHYVQ